LKTLAYRISDHLILHPWQRRRREARFDDSSTNFTAIPSILDRKEYTDISTSHSWPSSGAVDTSHEAAARPYNLIQHGGHAAFSPFAAGAPAVRYKSHRTHRQQVSCTEPCELSWLQCTRLGQHIYLLGQGAQRRERWLSDGCGGRIGQQSTSPARTQAGKSGGDVPVSSTCAEAGSGGNGGNVTFPEL